MKQLIDLYTSQNPALQNLIALCGAILLGLFLRGLSFWLFRQYYHRRKSTVLTRSIQRRLGRVLTVLFPLLMVAATLNVLRLQTKAGFYFHKLVEVLLIGAFIWLIIKIIYVAQDVVYAKYELKEGNNLRIRKLRTQIEYIRKISLLVVGIIGLSLILLNFESVRSLGAGLLTSAGVGGIIVGLAAQKSIANLVAGFQIAFTQPIRIDDVVIVEGEWGRIEEITLTYVVVRIWDMRRLIVPINYFIENTFENWTRTSADIMGTIFLHTDYDIPLEPLRAELRRLCELSPYWDKKVCVLQVTDATESTLQLRALVSATNSGNAWELRVFIREKLIEFIRENYPQSLPRTRAEISRLMPHPAIDISESDTRHERFTP